MEAIGEDLAVVGKDGMVKRMCKGKGKYSL